MRNLNTKLHRWLGLGLGLFLAFQGLTGAFLHVGGDLDRWLNPGLDPAGYRPQAPRFDAVIAAAREVAPESRVVFVDAPRAERNSYRVVLDDALGERLYLHPQTLTLLLRRGAFAEPVDVVEALHTGVLGGEALEIALGIVGLLAIPLLVTGLIRWWPRPGRVLAALRILWRNARQFVFTSHRSAGALGALVLLFIVATGTALSFHEAMHALASGISGQPARPERPGAGSGDWSRELSLDALARQASERAGGAEPRFVILPRRPGDPIVFRLRHNNEWHPSGRSEVYFHPATGDMIDGYVVGERNGTQRLLDSLYPLHIAAPLGAWAKALGATAGLLLVYFSLSGVLIWWWRRQRVR